MLYEGSWIVDEATLEKLTAHEARYFTFAAHLEQTPNVWFLHDPEISEYHDVNHALHLRADGASRASLDNVADSVVAFYRERGLPPVAAVDPIAERQGIGAALRRRGLMPATDSMRLMRYTGGKEQGNKGGIEGEWKGIENAYSTAPEGDSQKRIEIRRVPNETGNGEAQTWIDIQDNYVLGDEDEAMWRKVARAEARSPDCLLYLAYLDGQPVGAADLFQFDGWGRVESVTTHPDFRRRGVATALVGHIVAASLAMGNTETYLLAEPGGDAERIYQRLGFEEWAANPFRRHILR